jgi:hypothetical protein
MNRSQAGRGKGADRQEYSQGGPPNARPRERGSRQNDEGADSALPAREAGAGGQVDDGPRGRDGGPRSANRRGAS